MSTTPRLALTREVWSTQVADVVDRLVSLFEGHEHAGDGSTISNPASAPTATLSTVRGALLPDTDYYWKVSWVDAFGGESLPGPEVHLHTPAGQAVPPAPLLSTASGGTLSKGINYWALTAISTGGIETKLGPTNYVQIDTSNRTVDLSWTYADSTAQISVWRRGPFIGGWTRIATLAGGTTVYVDNGSVPDDTCACDNGDQPPGANSVIGQYAVDIALTEAIPTDATAWYLYVTRQAGAYTSPALVHQVVETDTGGALLTGWTDAGDSRLARTPVGVNTSIGSPKAAAALLGTDAERLAYDVAGLPDAVFWYTTDTFKLWVSDAGAWVEIETGSGVSLDALIDEQSGFTDIELFDAAAFDLAYRLSETGDPNLKVYELVSSTWSEVTDNASSNLLTYGSYDPHLAVGDLRPDLSDANLYFLRSDYVYGSGGARQGLAMEWTQTFPAAGGFEFQSRYAFLNTSTGTFKVFIDGVEHVPSRKTSFDTSPLFTAKEQLAVAAGTHTIRFEVQDTTGSSSQTVAMMIYGLTTYATTLPTDGTIATKDGRIKVLLDGEWAPLNGAVAPSVIDIGVNRRFARLFGPSSVQIGDDIAVHPTMWEGTYIGDRVIGSMAQVNRRGSTRVGSQVVIGTGAYSAQEQSVIVGTGASGYCPNGTAVGYQASVNGTKDTAIGAGAYCDTDYTRGGGFGILAPVPTSATPSTTGGTLPPGTQFRYRITAVDSLGLETDVNGVLNATTGLSTATNKVTVTWAASTSAVGYRIYGGVPFWNEGFLAQVGAVTTWDHTTEQPVRSWDYPDKNFTIIPDTTYNTCIGADTYSDQFQFQTLVGANGYVAGDLATGLGYGADCEHTMSTAVGANSTTTANNQVMLGTSSETVHIPGFVDNAGSPSVTATGTHTVLVDNGTTFCNGTFTVTLPTPVNNGHRYVIKNIGSGTITVASPSGTVEVTSLAAGVSKTYESDGTNYYSI